MIDESAHPAARIAALFALDPVGLGGVVLRSRASPGRDAWLAGLKSLLPATAPVLKVPLRLDDDRLLGGLDLTATLRAGRPIAQLGLLAQADGGVLLLAMAERIDIAMAARLAIAIDTRTSLGERDGVTLRSPSCFGVVAFDEGIDEECAPQALRERTAFHLSLDEGDAADLSAHWPWSGPDIASARQTLPGIGYDAGVIDALCRVAWELGIESVRAPIFALRCAVASAALSGRRKVHECDVALAARLVFAARVTTLPADSAQHSDVDSSPLASPTQCADPQSPMWEGEPATADGAAAASSTARPTVSGPAQEQGQGAGREQGPGHDGDGDVGTVGDRVLAAAVAAIPPGLLIRLRTDSLNNLRERSRHSGRAGASKWSTSRGRPAGVIRGRPSSGARLNVLETLRAGAPWQTLRRREQRGDLPGGNAGPAACGQAGSERLRIRSEDFRLGRFKQRSETTTAFVVDASGSAALHRLAEAKGAVELLLGDCYVRRDKVALIAFRGSSAEMLLSPTRSLVRAKRSLAGLPGGGGTPLAAGLDAASALVEVIRERGGTPVVVVLTDGRANVARDGGPGRVRANADAMSSARRMRSVGAATLLLDTADRPQQTARDLADAMGAVYMPLPHAGAMAMSKAVRDVRASARDAR